MIESIDISYESPFSRDSNDIRKKMLKSFLCVEKNRFVIFDCFVLIRASERACISLFMLNLRLEI